MLVALPLLTVGSGAGAGTSPVLRDNGLIAVHGTDGMYVVGADGSAARLLPGTSPTTGDPAWSPDGSLLAVTDGAGVYTMKPDGSERRLVVRNAWSPSWTPDGKRLLVVHDTCDGSDACPDGGGPGLATVELDGSDVQPVALGGESLDEVVEGAWSPDGAWLAVATVAGVKLVPANGESDAARSLAKDGYNLSWSPDSSKLAFDRFLEQADTVQQVVVLADLQTGKETILRGNGLGATGAAWSPDGKQLAFLSLTPAAADNQGGCGGHQEAQLWVAAADGTNARQLTKGIFSGPASWAPAQATASDAVPAPAPADKAPVGVSDKPPAAKQKPAATPPNDAAPAPADVKVVKGLPSSGGGRIAARGADGLYLVSARRGGADKIPGTEKMDRPAWSPDRTLIAVEQGSSVYTIRPDGSGARLVVENASSPAWSADGSRIFVSRSAAADVETDLLLSVATDGSDLHEVTEEEFYEETGWPADGAYLNFFTDEQAQDLSLDSSEAAWSPDGAWLAFAGSGGIWAVDANGANLHLLARGAFGALSWGAGTSD